MPTMTAQRRPSFLDLMNDACALPTAPQPLIDIFPLPRPVAIEQTEENTQAPRSTAKPYEPKKRISAKDRQRLKFQEPLARQIDPSAPFPRDLAPVMARAVELLLAAPEGEISAAVLLARYGLDDFQDVRNRDFERLHFDMWLRTMGTTERRS